MNRFFTRFAWLICTVAAGLAGAESTPIERAAREFIDTGTFSNLLSPPQVPAPDQRLPTELVPLLITALHDPEPDHAHRAWCLPEGYVDQTSLLVPAYTALLAESNADNGAVEIAQRLGGYGPEAQCAIPVLLRLLEDAPALAETIGNIGRRPDLVLGPLLAHLASPYDAVATPSATALASNGFIAHAPRIVPAPIARLAALPPAIPRRLMMQGPYTAEQTLRLTLIGAIGAIGWPAHAAAPLLRKLIDSDDEVVANAAAVALSLTAAGPSPDAALLARFGLSARAPLDNNLAVSPMWNLGANAAGAVPVLASAWAKADATMRDRLVALIDAIGPAAGACAPLIAERIAESQVPASSDLLVLAHLGEAGFDTLNGLSLARGEKAEYNQESAYAAIATPSGAPGMALRDALENPAPRRRCLGLITLRSWMALRPDLIELALPSIDDADSKVRIAAIEVCGAAGPAAEAAIPRLRRLLAIRGQEGLASMRALGMIGAKAASAVAEIATYLRDNDPWRRRVALSTLCRLGEAARPELDTITSLTTDPDRNVRRWAAAAACRLAPPSTEMVAALIDYTENDEPIIGSDIAEALIAAGPVAGVGRSQIHHLLMHRYMGSHWSEALLCQGVEPSTDAPALASRLDLDVDCTADRVLAACGAAQPEVIPALHRACRSRGLPRAWACLARLGDEPALAAQCIAQQAMHGARRERMAALDALAELGTLALPARPWLEALVHDGDGLIALRALAILQTLQV
jgi:hypothetical protein